MSTKLSTFNHAVIFNEVEQTPELSKRVEYIKTWIKVLRELFVLPPEKKSFSWRRSKICLVLLQSNCFQKYASVITSLTQDDK